MMQTTHSGSFDVIVWLLVTTVIHGVRHGVHAATGKHDNHFGFDAIASILSAGTRGTDY